MKPWYESKTIWLGVATIATALVSALVGALSANMRETAAPLGNSVEGG